tara:strand:- start:199 stop:687 length:489 start_codon:yes stop_codon:yes gene_type:complete
MLNLKIKDYLKLIFLISLISIIFAYFIEYILGHQPCNLCILERIPYIVSMILIIFTFLFKNNEKFFLLLLILVFTFSSLISLYHLGIEQDFFQESSICGVKNIDEPISKEELLKQLGERTISCRDVTFKIFGLSLTSINVILSLILTIFLIYIFKKYEKNKH